MRPAFARIPDRLFNKAILKRTTNDKGDCKNLDSTGDFIGNLLCEAERKQSTMQAVQSDLDQPAQAGTILDMEIDLYKQFYFAMTGYYGRNSYLYREVSGKSEFEVMNSHFVETGQMIFDKKNTASPNDRQRCG